jgi:hypothetical protein
MKKKTWAIKVNGQYIKKFKISSSIFKGNSLDDVELTDDPNEALKMSFKAANAAAWVYNGIAENLEDDAD